MLCPIYQKHCLCCSVRNGALFIAWLFMISSVAAAGALAWLSVYLQNPNYEFIIALFVALSILTMSFCICNFFLLLGLYKKNPAFMLPWLTLIIISILIKAILSLIFLLFLPPSDDSYNYMCLNFYLIGIDFFSFIVVLSSYKELREKNKSYNEARFYPL